MIKLLKTYWLSVVVLFVIFFDETFNCTAIVGGFTVEAGMKQYEAILMAAIGYSMLAYDILKGKIRKCERRTLVILFLIMFLYMMTPVFYGPNDNHTAYLLAYGAECIPAAIIGMRFAKSINLQKVNNLLPFAVIPSSLLIGTIGLAAAMMGTTVGAENYREGGESGLNYQTLSYFMAFSYTYAFYYTFYGNKRPGLINTMLRAAMAADMLFCVAICMLGGGRGGFVYIVAITFFLIFYFLKTSKKHRIHAIIIIILLVVVAFYVVLSMGVMQSAGMERVTGRLSEDNTRIELYQKAFDAFLSSPIIGKGLGSIWWTVGFYCHNMILDILAETGLIGTVFFLSIVWQSFKKLYRLSDSNKFFFFLLLVITGNFVNCLFSGYYITALKFYFVCTLTYCLPKSMKKDNALVSSGI